VHDILRFGFIVAILSATTLLAVYSNHLSQRVQVPAPALFVAGAALVANTVPGVHPPSLTVVERVVTVALAIILFDGGMHIGVARLRRALRPVLLAGVAGTFLVVAATTLICGLLLGFDWYAAVLVATAVAPTDPAVVFSVLGKREVAEPAGTILEGESGANDPVGIALMASLVAAGGIGAHAVGRVGVEFVQQMGVGLAIGVVGGRVLLWSMRRIPLPSEGLYPLRTLASALLLYGVATVAHGSGFLAVFVAGILISDANAPYKREIERFHAATASLAEIVAFGILGLTINTGDLTAANVWGPGLAIGLLLLLVIRPVLVGLCLTGSRLRRNQAVFVLFAGLKGAVPILLGSLLLQAPLNDRQRFYGVIVIVVAFSVLVQGTLTPTVAGWLRVPMRTIEPEPWALGVRLRNEPEGVHRLTVASGARADGERLEDLAIPDGAWVSFAVRRGHLVTVSADTRFEAGDELLVLGEPELRDQLLETFGAQRPGS
jgi:cell volume regulation protein A